MSRLLLIILLTGFFSCQTAGYRDLELVVSRDLVTFTPAEVPARILQEARRHELVFIGETHYLQQHQEYLLTLMQALNGQGSNSVMLNELSHAYGWMADDYVQGIIEEVPEKLRFFDQELLEGFRAYNIQNQGKPIKFLYFDANQQGAFPTSLDEISKLLPGNTGIPGSVSGIPVDSPEYLQAVNQMLAELELNRERYMSDWGDDWFGRIHEIVKVEVASIAYRRDGFDPSIREQIMQDNIARFRDRYGHLVINCGFFHAQKVTLMGQNIPRIAGRFGPDIVYSVVFSAIEGERKINFYDEDTFEFDIEDESSRRDLVRIMAERAEVEMGFLPLLDPVFSEKVRVTYASGTTYSVVPALQFDAIVTYPEVDLLNSMTAYSY